jgi:hypothetical protein
MPVTVPNPYGYNDPALGQSMTNIAQILFGAEGPYKAEERREKSELTAAHTGYYGAGTQKLLTEEELMRAQQEALNQAAEAARAGVDWRNPDSRNNIAAYIIQSGKTGENAGRGLYYTGSPDDENIARWLTPGLTGEAVGVNQAGTAGGADKIRAAGYENELAKARIGAKATVDAAGVRANSAAEKTPLDITPAESQAFRREVEASLGLFYDKDGNLTADSGAPIDLTALNTIMSRGMTEYQKTRNAGAAIQNALAATPLREVPDKPEISHWFSPNEPAVNKRVLAAPPGVAPSAAPMTNAVAAPPPAQRISGQVYATPRGPMKWTGTGWLPQ